MARKKAPTRIAKQTVEVINDWGLHARPSAALAQLVKGYKSKVTVTLGERSAPALSISSLLMLEAVKGSTLSIEIEGEDAQQALQAVVNLFEGGFGEEHVVLQGQGTKCGIVIGDAHILLDKLEDIPNYKIKKNAVAAERKRLSDAVAAETKVYRKVVKDSDSEIMSEFGQLVLSMLEDEHMLKRPSKFIDKGLMNAEWALKISVDEILDAFSKLDDPIWQSRADDYLQLMLRLVKRMSASRTTKRSRAQAGKDKIVVAGKIGPTEVIEYYRAGYSGFVSSSSSGNSHAAILARGLGLPAIVALEHNALEELEEGTLLVLDSDASELHVKPNKQLLESKRSEIKARKKKSTVQPREPAGGPRRTISMDGIRIRLMANTEFLDEVAIARGEGAEGVGLFRTEFLFLNDELPTEDEQYEFYCKVLKELDGLPITFRTIDIGHDKSSERLGTSESPLGVRAIRFCLQQPELFKNQLRALLRASEHGPLKIMFPMIASVQEYQMALQLVHEAAEELGWPAGNLPEIGSMIEIPGAVFAMKNLAANCDFFSIGSNDLIQYTLAIDRNAASLAHLADPCHPGVMFLLKQICRQSLDLSMPLTMCGELAADPRMACLLCALGVREFSMSPNKIQEVRSVIRNFKIMRNADLANEIVEAQSVEEARKRLDQLI